MLKTALLVLTLTDAGATRVTLSQTDTLADCEAGRDAVTAILGGAGVEVLAALCGESALRVTPFEHGVPPEQEVHRYRVEIVGEDFVVTPLAEAEACAPAPDAEPAVHCAVSAQTPVE